MDVMALHFIRPGWLLLLPLAILIPVLWRRLRRPSGDWSRVCDDHLLRWLSVGKASAQPGRLGPWIAGLVWLVAAIALAGPGWEKLPDSSFTSRDARVLVLDLSMSMMAEDLKPNRLTQAGFRLSDMLNETLEGQTGLVAYAGDAFVVSPLTSDTNTIRNMLPALRPDVIPVSGSRPDRALELAAELLERSGFTSGEILLIADGGSQATVSLADQLTQQGIYTSVLAVGTPQGAPVPSGDGFVSDSKGNIVVARLQRDVLQAIASAGGGRYSELTAGSNTDSPWASAEGSEFARRDEALGERCGQPRLLLAGPGQKVAAHRHRHFRGRRRGGRAPVGGEIDQRCIGLVADGRDQRDLGTRCGAHHNLFVEPPQILDRPAAARDDDEVGPGQRTARGECVETLDRPGHFARAFLALDRHRPDQHLAGKPVAQPVQDVADHRARGRGDHTDDLRQVRDLLLRVLGEQPFRLEQCLAFLEHRHQRADARGGDLLDHDLVLRLAREGGEPPGRHHFHPLLGLGRETRRDPLPDHARQHRAVVLEVEIDMAGPRPTDPADLRAHAHMGELALDHALYRAGKLRDGKLGGVAGLVGIVDEVHGRETRPDRRGEGTGFGAGSSDVEAPMRALVDAPAPRSQTAAPGAAGARLSATPGLVSGIGQNGSGGGAPNSAA